MNKRNVNIAALMTLMLAITLTVATSLTSANQDALSPEKKAEKEEMRAALEQRMTEVEAAIEAGDFSAWSTLIAESKHAEQLTEKVTSDNFDRFAEAHALIKEGRQKIKDGMTILNDEIGIEHPGKGSHGFHKKGFHMGAKAGFNKRFEQK